MASSEPSNSQPYVSRKEVLKSYRPKSYEMSPGLKRAREPYKIRNALTGIVIASFAVGVWAYSISAVKQDNFDDLDEEAKVLTGAGSASQPTKTPAETSTTAPTPVFCAVFYRTGTIRANLTSSEDKRETGSEGVLAAVLEKPFPSLLDPTSKTIVWGAPSVDNVGKLRDSRRT